MHAHACLTTPTWNECANLMVLYMSNLIQKFYFTPQLVCESWRILHKNCVVWRILNSDWSRGFRTINQETDFSQFLKNTRKLLDDHYKSIRVSLLFSYSTKKVQKTGLHCCQKPKNLILGPFLRLFGVSWPDGTFFQK